MWSRAGAGSVGAAAAALGLALGGTAVERGPLALAGRWLEGAGGGPRSVAGLLGLPTWVLVAAAVPALVAVAASGGGRMSAGQRWLMTGAAVGSLGVLAWLAGGRGGWNWGLSITGPSRSLLGILVLGDGVASADWGSLMLVGLVVGSAASAWLGGRLGWRAPAAPELARRFGGGWLMGIGGTLAGGCNIGNALTGLSALSTHSLIATAGIVLGALAALGWRR